MDIFGPQYNYDYVKSKIKETVKRYGGRKGYNVWINPILINVQWFKAQNVVAPNGNIDPWHALGLRKDDTPNQEANHVVPILIPGTAHCADMGPALSRDPPELTNARNTIFKNIKEWLGVTETGEESNSKRFKRSLHKQKEIGHKFVYSYKTEQFSQLIDHPTGPTGNKFQQVLLFKPSLKSCNTVKNF